VCTLKVQGGYERYSIVVPDRCMVEINRLIVPGESSSTVIGDMQSLVNQLGLSADVEVRTKPPYYEPFEIDPEETIVKVFAEAYEEVRGTNPQFGYNVGITDANVFAGEGGIPTIHHGPHGQGAHQANEFVQLQDLKPTALVDALTAIKFLR
jgi:acetylornithine deacetylase